MLLYLPLGPMVTAAASASVFTPFNISARTSPPNLSGGRDDNKGDDTQDDAYKDDDHKDGNNTKATKTLTIHHQAARRRPHNTQLPPPHLTSLAYPLEERAARCEGVVCRRQEERRAARARLRAGVSGGSSTGHSYRVSL